MAFSLDSIFTTRTALPQGCGITEIRPSAWLKPYVRCFWRCNSHAGLSAMRIIPDCCADIIIPLDGGKPVFVGASDIGFVTHYMSDVFGIRFFAWSVAPFLHINLSESFNNAVHADDVLKDFKLLQSAVMNENSMVKQVELAQNYLSQQFDGKLCFDVLNGIYRAVSENCRVDVGDLSEYCAVSKRTLERKFIENIGIAPKTIIELLRYQLLWQDCIKNGFSVADSTFKFGYYDDAHMYNNFKRYHGIGLGEARAEYKNLSRFYNT